MLGDRDVTDDKLCCSFITAMPTSVYARIPENHLKVWRNILILLSKAANAIQLTIGKDGFIFKSMGGDNTVVTTIELNR